MNRAMDMDEGDGRTPLWTYLIPPAYALKSEEDGEFYGVYILPQ